VQNPLQLLKAYPRQFRLMFFGMLISAIGSSMIWPFLMIFVSKRLNIALTEATSLFTINASAGIIAAIIAGPITDRFGRKWVMVISLAGNGMVYFFMGSAHTYVHFAILMTLSGAFNPLYRVGADAMLADLIPSENRADAYAMIRLSNNAGIAIGPILGGLLSTISYSITFVCAGIGMLIYSFLLVFFAYETLPKIVETSPGSSQFLGGYVKVLRDTQFIYFVVAFILAQMCTVMIWTLMPVYANTNFSVPESQIGFIPTTNALMVVFFQVFVTSITKKYKPVPVMMLGTAFYTLAVGSVSLGHSFLGFWISIVIMTVGELILMPTASTYVAAIAPVDMRGRYMSIAGLTWSAALGIGPIIGGFLNDNIAPVAIWYGGLLIGILGIFGFYMLSRKQPKVQPAMLPE
jgi:MFS family permease